MSWYMSKPLVVSVVALALSSVVFSGWTPGQHSPTAVPSPTQDEASLIQKDVALHRAASAEGTDLDEQQLPGMQGFTLPQNMPGGNQVANIFLPKPENKRLNDANREAVAGTYGEGAGKSYERQHEVERALQVGGPMAAALAYNRNARESIAEASAEQDKFLSYADGYGENATEAHLRQIRFEEDLMRALQQSFSNEELPGPRIDIVMKRYGKTMKDYPEEFIKHANAQLAKDSGEKRYEQYLQRATIKMDKQQADLKVREERKQAKKDLARLTAEKTKHFVAAQNANLKGDATKAESEQKTNEELTKRIEAITLRNQQAREKKMKLAAQEAEGKTSQILDLKLETSVEDEKSDESDESGSSRGGPVAVTWLGALALVLVRYQ